MLPCKEIIIIRGIVRAFVPALGDKAVILVLVHIDKADISAVFIVINVICAGIAGNLRHIHQPFIYILYAFGSFVVQRN